MILKRFGSTPMGTFGKMDVMGKELTTVECPWIYNRPYISCVPLGVYQLLWRPTTTSVPAVCEGHSWYLMGETVGFSGSDKERQNCCFHIGNVSADVSGCISPGLDYGYPYNQWGVINSRQAMEVMFSLIGPNDTELIIIGNSMG